jgi:hypothetical protein
MPEPGRRRGSPGRVARRTLRWRRLRDGRDSPGARAPTCAPGGARTRTQPRWPLEAVAFGALLAFLFVLLCAPEPDPTRTGACGPRPSLAAAVAVSAVSGRFLGRELVSRLAWTGSRAGA